MSLFPSEAYHHYLAMWNERDPERIRGHLDQAVTEDFVFCDPVDDHVGRDALEHNVRNFRAKFPDADLRLASGVDAHHNRCRYNWRISVGDEVLLEGFDAVTTADGGLIERIDGFFGPLPPPTDD